MNAGSTVQKGLNDQEKTILANIESLVAQLKSVEGAEMQEAPPGSDMEKTDEPAAPGVDSEVTPEDKDSDGAKVAQMKKCIAKKADGSNANDDAEERIDDDLPEEGKDALAIAAKALMALAKGQGVAKSQRPTSPEMAAIGELATVVKSLAANQEMLGDTLTGILGGMGVTEKVIKSAAPATQARPAAVGGDAALVMKALLESAGIKVDGQVAKSESAGGMRDVLSSLVR